MTSANDETARTGTEHDVLGHRRAIQLTDLIIPIALFLAVLTLYVTTMTPGLGGTIDSAELQHAAYSLSIVHPTGYPLYLLLARAFIWLAPFGEVAWRVTLLSAVFGALAAVLVYAITTLLARSRIVGVLAAGLMATHPLVWQQATIAEVNSLNLLLVAALFFALVRWGQEPDRGRQPSLELAGLIFGLALANHRVSLFTLPGIMLFVIWSVRAGRRLRLGQIVRTIGSALLPLLLYLYIPLRADTTPWYTNTWHNFWVQVSGESAWPVIRETLGRPLLPRVRLVVDALFGDFSLAAVREGTINGLLHLAGLGTLTMTIRRWWGESLARRAMVSLLAPSGLLVAGVMVVYDVDVIGDYLSMVAMITAILAACGIAEGVRWGSSFVGRWWTRSSIPIPTLGYAGYTLVALAIIWHGWSAEPRMDRSGDDSARVFWSAIQEREETPGALPKDAILIGTWNRLNELRYLQSVEDWRPDLHPVVADDLVHTGRISLIDEWLAQRRAVYLLDGVPAILDQFRVDRQGFVWQVVARGERERPPMEQPLGVRFGDDVELLGYTLEPDEVRPGEQLRITLFWRAIEPIAQRYVVFAHLIGEADGKIGQRDDEPGSGERPTTAWIPNETIADSLLMVVDPNASPGTYHLMVGMYTRIGAQRLPVTGPSGEPLGDYWQMAEVTVLP